MRKNLLFIFSAICLLAGCAQQPKLPTFRNTGNPLVKDKFTADPAPLVHNDTLYLYVGHDEYYEGQDTAHGGKEFNITEWLCYSTKDMQTWTDHGVVLKPTDFKWGIGEAWAAQVIEHDGKFYYYTTVQAGEPYNSKAIGVAVSDSPTGPFTDAIGKPLVTDDMTPNGPRGWWNDIDPTALIDENGQAWLSWGNGTCFLAKLKPNLTEIDGDIEVIDLPRYVEGPWLHKRGDLLPYVCVLRTRPREYILCHRSQHGGSVDTARRTDRYGRKQLHHSSGNYRVPGTMVSVLPQRCPDP